MEKEVRSRVGRSAEERTELLIAHAESGLSKKAFCQQRGLNLATFYSWGKLKAPETESADFARFEVDLPAERDAPIEVDLPNGVRITVRTSGEVGKTAELIRQVIRPERESY